MITNATEYNKAEDELRVLQERLQRLQETRVRIVNQLTAG